MSGWRHWHQEDDEPGHGACMKCNGDGKVPARRMGIIAPWTEQVDCPGEFYVCPRCGGNGKEP